MAQAGFGFGALCNSVSLVELVNLVSSDFLDEQDKEDLLGSIHGPLRYGYSREIGFSYKQPGYRLLDIYKKGQGFSIKNKYYNSARISHDLLKMIFYGNKPYAGQTLNLGSSRYETWYYTTLDYQFDMMLDSLQPITLSVGINVGHDYNFYKVKTADLYTDPDGAYLDLDADYRLRDRILESQTMAGIGLSVGAATTYKLSKNTGLELEVEDLGFVVWSNGRSVDADSTFRFKGAEFDNIFDLNDSITSAARNEYEDEFYYNKTGSYLRLTPFRLRASYKYALEKRRLKALSLTADYRYLAGYYPRLALGAHFKTGYKQMLLVQLTTGGYTLASLDLAYEFTIARDWRVNMAITNFSGLVIPVISGGAYGVIGLSYEL